MRALVALILGAMALWAGYWAVGQRVIEGRAEAVLQEVAERSAVEIAHSGVAVAGFPNRFDLTLAAPRVLDPFTGWGWQAEFAQVFAMTWKPWQVIAVLPLDQEIATPRGPVHLTSARFAASALVEPSATLALEEVVVEADAPRLAAAFLPPVAADRALFALRRQPAREGAAYRLGVTLAALSPLVAAPSDLATAEVRLDARLDLAAPIDRDALGRPAALRAADLAALSVRRGDVVINASGRVVAGEGGLAEGEILFRVQGWRHLPALLADYALIRPEWLDRADKALAVMAEEQGQPETLDLPLRFEAGWSFLGPLPLGPAPLMDGG